MEKWGSASEIAPMGKISFKAFYCFLMAQPVPLRTMPEPALQRQCPLDHISFLVELRYGGKPVTTLRAGSVHVSQIRGVHVDAHLSIYAGSPSTSKFRTARRHWHRRRRDLSDAGVHKTWRKLFSRAWGAGVQPGLNGLAWGSMDDDPAGMAFGRSLEPRWYACSHGRIAQVTAFQCRGCVKDIRFVDDEMGFCYEDAAGTCPLVPEDVDLDDDPWRLHNWIKVARCPNQRFRLSVRLEFPDVDRVMTPDEVEQYLGALHWTNISPAA